MTKHGSEALAREVTPAVIDMPYLMVTFIPCYRDENGGLWFELGWHHDLREHLSYLKDFILCAPSLQKSGQANLAPMQVPDGAGFRYVELPNQGSVKAALLNLPKTARVLWRAIGECEVVHSSIVGWPYPLGWIANPFAILRRKALVIIVESSWRRAASEKQTLLRRAWDFVKDLAARWCCSHATVALFTQPAYRDSLYRGKPDRAYITPAVWINEADVMDEGQAQRRWEDKMSLPVSMLFAGRLAAAKGVEVLLHALRILDNRGVKMRVDIIGEGSLRESCVATSATLSSVKLSVLDTVPYGKPFFELVQKYHAVLIPSLSDEQPRVVFDANSQAVPVIASNTPGLRPHVENGKTGWLIDQGNPEVLAAAMEIAMADPEKLHSMGMRSLAATKGYTHVAMHRTRSQILNRHLFIE